MTIKRALATALTIFVSLVVLVGFVRYAASDTRSSDPSVRRSWAQHPSTIETLRSTSASRPEWPLTIGETSFEITYDEKLAEEQTWAGVEYPSAPNFLIPGSPTRRGLQLNAALVYTQLPGDELGSGGWRDPNTWEPTTPDMKAPIVPSSSQPTYMVYLLLAGGGGELRIVSHALFDLGTGLRLGTGTTRMRLDQGIILGTNIDLPHRAPLELLLRYAHGEPTFGKLDMHAGAKWTHGSHISLEFLHAIEGSKRSYGSGNGTIRGKWGPPWFADLPQSVVLLRVWPPEARHQVEVRAAGERNWHSFHNRQGVDLIELWGVPLDDVEHLEVRYLPEIGISRLEVPCPPEFPELDNLFAARIPYLEVTSKYQLYQALETLLGAQFARHQAGSPTATTFPLIFEEATVSDVWQAAEAVHGSPLYWIEDRLEITDQKPDFWGDLREMFARLLP